MAKAQELPTNRSNNTCFDSLTVAGIEREEMPVNIPRAVLLIGLLITVNNAEATPDEAGVHFTGGTIGVGLLGGTTLLTDTNYDEGSGYMTGVQARIMSVMQVIDLALEYSYEGNQFRAHGAPIKMGRHSLTYLAHVHPLFLRLLGNNHYWYTVASWFLQVGLSADFSRLKSDQLGIDKSSTDFGLVLGSGFETPIDSPNDGGAFWLGFNYRWKLAFAGTGISGHENTDTHQFLLTLSYRSNNISGARIKRPPELKYR